MITDFTTITNLKDENSFGTIRKQDEVTVEVTIELNLVDGTGTGWFEFGTEDGEWYGGGGLWFKDHTLYEYDGVWDLPYFVCEWLQKQKLDPNIED